MKRKTLTQFLVEQQRLDNAMPAKLRLLIEVAARAYKVIGHAVNKGAISGVLGSLTRKPCRARCRKSSMSSPKISFMRPTNGVSDAVRILLTRVAAEGGLPVGLTATPDAYDSWFRAKVQEALNDPGPCKPHDQVVREAHALIDAKRRA